MTEQKTIRLAEIEPNKGQIEGLPANPRKILKKRLEALKRSIEDAPEMLGLRELLVFKHNGKYVVVGGNMRLRACQDLGYQEVPCKVLPEETPVAKLREYAIKDNVAFGQDDASLLAAFANESYMQYCMSVASDATEELRKVSHETSEPRQVQLPPPSRYVLLRLPLNEHAEGLTLAGMRDKGYLYRDEVF